LDDNGLSDRGGLFSWYSVLINAVQSHLEVNIKILKSKIILR
jgi:hypothetical protein